MMKKMAAILAAVSLSVSLCACGQNAETGNEKTDNKTREMTENTGAEQSETKRTDNAAETEPAAETMEDTKVGTAYKTPEMKGEISINVYDQAEWLESAIAMFEKKYPDMKVNLNVFFTGTDNTVVENGGETMQPRPEGQTREDYIKWLNTQLLSGEAEDIVITSIGLPLGRYVEMGVFEDLSPYLKAAEEINENDYYMNIFKAYETEQGELYEMPVSAAAIPLLSFDRDLMKECRPEGLPKNEAMTWREALDLAEELYDKTSLQSKTYMPDPRTTFGDIITKEVIKSVDYHTGEVNLNEETIKKLLAVFDEIKSYPVMSGYEEGAHETFKISYLQDDEAAYYAVKEGEIFTQWKAEDGKVYLSPYYSLDFGITQKSKNKELAWEFLRFLVSEEVQTLPSVPYAGVNKKGLEARIKGYADRCNASAEETKEMVALMDGWVSQITGYQDANTDLITISLDIQQKYWNGEINAEETIDLLEERLKQFMNG